MRSALCFLDMDGVLADFNRGVHEAHGRSDVYADNPAALGVFDIETLWGVTAQEFWKPTRRDGFWEGLEKFENADGLVEMLSNHFGVENICILSSPSEDYRCIPEKKAWIKKHYPQLAKNMLFGSAKEFLAGARRFLVDDRDKNIDDFREHGGIGLIYPQLWNRCWQLVDRRNETVLYGLNQWRGAMA